MLCACQLLSLSGAIVSTERTHLGKYSVITIESRQCRREGHKLAVIVISSGERLRRSGPILHRTSISSPQLHEGCQRRKPSLQDPGGHARGLYHHCTILHRSPPLPLPANTDRPLPSRALLFPTPTPSFLILLLHLLLIPSIYLSHTPFQRYL
jgi:hypothetical protein